VSLSAIGVFFFERFRDHVIAAAAEIVKGGDRHLSDHRHRSHHWHVEQQGVTMSEAMIGKAVDAMRKLEGRDSRFQGFLYDEGTAHVIRDVCLPDSGNVLWKLVTHDYETGHAAMMAEIDRLKKEEIVRVVLEAAGIAV
jgi:hypothetical protein